MATTVIFEVKAKPGTGNDLLATFRQILPDTRSYDGCLGIDTYQNQDDPDTLIILGKWESKGQFEKYLGWRQETGVFDRVASVVEGPPNTRYFNLTDA